MSEFRTIEIDFDIHKMIEMARRGFMESPNDVLRRLLEIGEPSPEHSETSSNGRSWTGKGVILPHGTELRMKYRGRQYSGVIDDGQWLVEGERFTSPSDAAMGVAVTKDGQRPSLNGWIYWSIRRPGDTDWISIIQARQMVEGS